jgi:uncharacterized protein
VRLLDVNMLVTAHRVDADRHAEVRAWLEKELSDFPGIAVSELVLSGSIRVLTHPRVFKVPTPLSTALQFVEDLRLRETVTVLSPGERHWSLFLSLCRRAEARGNLVPDAYHAALAIEHGCEWITLDRGFARYPGLVWRHPLD